MRILIADDHAILRQGLRALLETGPGFQVVGEASDGLQAVEMVQELQPDLVIMDIAMPGLDGIKATRQIKEGYPGTRVLVLSMHADSSYVRRALKSGASGFLLKETAFDELKIALEFVNQGKPYLSPTLLTPVLQNYLDSAPEGETLTRLDSLTPRELEVLGLLGQDYGRQQIAEQLYISLKTVDQHKKNIKEKLEIQGPEDIKKFAAWAGREGE